MRHRSNYQLYLDENETVNRWMEEDIRTSSILQTMEAVEDWVVQGTPDVEKAMQRLANAINQHGNSRIIGKISADLLFVLAYAKTGRAMHMLSYLDNKFQGSGLRIVQAAASMAKLDEMESAEGRLMVERLEILRRIRHLSAIFSQSRLRFVIKALQEVNDELN